MGQIQRKFEDVETNLLFNLINMADILLNDIDRRFRAEGARFCQQKKQNYNKFINKAREAIKWFDEAIADDYWEGAENVSYSYDKMRFEANELIRLNLLYIDRVALNPGNFQLIFDHINSLKSCGIVSQEDLSHFQKVKLKAHEAAKE